MHRVQLDGHRHQLAVRAGEWYQRERGGRHLHGKWEEAARRLRHCGGSCERRRDGCVVLRDLLLALVLVLELSDGGGI